MYAGISTYRRQIATRDKLIVFSLVILTAYSLLLIFGGNWQTSHLHFHNTIENGSGTIHIAAVSCSKTGDLKPKEEAAVMIKSAIISAIMFDIRRDIQFHMFVEHDKDKEYFHSKLEEYGYPFADFDVSLRFYSAVWTVPKEYQNDLINLESLRCTYVRMFLPHALRHLDSVIYLDTDMIITGNLAEIWSYFGKMQGEQLVGVAPDFGAKSPETSIFTTDIPFPAPKGLNAGLLLMNLTKMRDYHWEEKHLRLYDDYAKRQKIPMNDQKLINILTYFDSGILMTMPCTFNYRPSNCLLGDYCEGIDSEETGLQIVHGSSNSFEPNKPFRDLFLEYRDFRLGGNQTKASIITNLMTPLRHKYKGMYLQSDEKSENRNCDLVLSNYLFKFFYNSMHRPTTIKFLTSFYYK